MDKFETGFECLYTVAISQLRTTMYNNYLFFQVVEDHIQAFKGTNPVQDSYSVLYPKAEPNNNTSGEALAARLRGFGITDLFLCGLAYDVCVGSTALDSSRLGFRTIVVEDACRGVDDKRLAKMKTTMRNAGCVIVKSDEVNMECLLPIIGLGT